MTGQELVNDAAQLLEVAKWPGLHTGGAADPAKALGGGHDRVEDFIAEIHPRLVAELQALHNGDPQPRLARSSPQEPVTLFGAGMSGRGIWDKVSGIFRSIASRWSECTDQRVEHLAAGVNGDLAYTDELEHTSVSVEGVPVAPYTLRVTQVYRREDGEWKVVHRHGDQISIDQSRAFPASIDGVAYLPASLPLPPPPVHGYRRLRTTPRRLCRADPLHRAVLPELACEQGVATASGSRPESCPDCLPQATAGPRLGGIASAGRPIFTHSQPGDLEIRRRSSGTDSSSSAATSTSSAGLRHRPSARWSCRTPSITCTYH